jgi:hypothetical protein
MRVGCPEGNKVRLCPARAIMIEREITPYLWVHPDETRCSDRAGYLWEPAMNSDDEEYRGGGAELLFPMPRPLSFYHKEKRPRTDAETGLLRFCAEPGM